MFEGNNEVWVRNFNAREKWIPGYIVAITGPVLLKVSTPLD